MTDNDKTFMDWVMPHKDTTKGGEGSGHFGHTGRPGKKGGSAPSGTPSTPAAQTAEPQKSGTPSTPATETGKPSKSGTVAAGKTSAPSLDDDKAWFAMEESDRITRAKILSKKYSRKQLADYEKRFKNDTISLSEKFESGDKSVGDYLIQSTYNRLETVRAAIRALDGKNIDL